MSLLEIILIVYVVCYIIFMVNIFFVDTNNVEIKDVIFFLAITIFAPFAFIVAFMLSVVRVYKRKKRIRASKYDR